MKAAADSARAWLAAIGGTAVPASLQARMEQALRDVAADQPDVADLFAAAALSCLQDALAQCEERDAALHLLAADALMTAACEAAAADADAAERLPALCAAYDVQRVAALAGLTPS
jgi:hypothetical protein